MALHNMTFSTICTTRVPGARWNLVRVGGQRLAGLLRLRPLARLGLLQLRCAAPAGLGTAPRVGWISTSGARARLV